MYQSMLRKFVAGQRSAVNDIRAALNSGDRATAERLAHTTKGVCGNIGAAGVQGLAGALEHAIMSGEGPSRLMALNDALAKSLVPLVRDIEAWLPAEQALCTATAATSVDEAALERVTTRLRALCGDMDSEAEELIDSEAALLSCAFPAHFEAMASAIRNFDFDTALTRLDAALSERR